MKRVLLLFAMASHIGFVTAQDRIVLYEEFTSENNNKCRDANYFIDTLLIPHDDVFIIKYQSTYDFLGGNLFQENPTDALQRMGYYEIETIPLNSDPYGFVDGTQVAEGLSYEGKVTATTHEILDNAAAIPTEIELKILNYSRTLGNDNITFDIVITSPIAQSFNNVVLQIALVESMDFDTPPGSNYERSFTNVVRKMYPDAEGQSIQNDFLINESQIFNIQAILPSYVDLNNPDLQFVVFLQNNDTKAVLNTAVSGTIENYAHALKLDSPFANEQTCGIVEDIKPSTTFKNVGTNDIHSMKLFYRTYSSDFTPSDWEFSEWTGNLAPLESTTFEYSGLESQTRRYYIQDSIGEINGIPISGNYKTSNFLNMVSLEDEPNELYPYANFIDDIEEILELTTFGIDGAIGFQSTSVYSSNIDKHMLSFRAYNVPEGEQAMMVLPLMYLPNSEKFMLIDMAYSSTNTEDALEVVYSEDCGDSWISVWQQVGQELATRPQHLFGSYTPFDEADFATKIIDITEVPSGAHIGIRATSGGGNNIYIDKVFLNDEIISTSELMNETNITAYPNPTNADINLKIESNLNGVASVVVYDIMGRQVHSTDVNLNGSSQIVTLSVNHLSAGIYSVQLDTEKDTQQVKFIKR